MAAMPSAIRFLFLVRLVNAAGSFVMPFMTMMLTIKLGWPADRTGLFMTCMAIAGGAGMLAGGKLGDCVGRKRLIVSCQAGASALYLFVFATGLGPALPYLVAAANLLLSATWPAFNAIVADLVPAPSRRRAYSLLYWGNNIGFSLGPIAAGLLFNAAAPLMFLCNALALAAVSSIMGFFVRESLPAEAPATPGPAAHPQPSPEAAEAGGMLAVLARRPLLLAFALVLALLNLVYAQQQFSLPLFLEARLGDRGPAAFGAAMTANGLTVVACTIPLAFLSRRLEPLACLPFAALLYGLGFGLLAFLPDGSGMPLVLASTFVWTLGEILSATSVNAFIASRSPSSHRSRMNSLVSLIAQSGSMLSPLVSGSFIAAFGLKSVWPAAALVGCVGAALMLTLYIVDRSKVKSA
jgi:MFS family permease